MILVILTITLIGSTALVIYFTSRPTRQFVATQRDELRAEVRRLEGLLTAKSLREAKILVELDATNKRLEGENNHLKLLLSMQPDRLASHRLKIHEVAAERLTADTPYFAQVWQQALLYAEGMVRQRVQEQTQILQPLKDFAEKVFGILSRQPRESVIVDI